MMNLVLFDLDGTLLPLDSDHAWGEYTTALGWTDNEVFKRRNDAFYAQYQARQLDIHEYVRFATDAMRQRGEQASLRAHQGFMQEVIEPVIRPCALELVQAHLATADCVMVVTATNDFVTRPIVQRLGIQELIATELERGPDGWLTGEIAGVPAFGAGKVQRVQQWLQARNLSFDEVRLTFYSDSINDLPLLEVAQQAIAVNADDMLRQLAHERDWRILDLFEEMHD